MFKKLTCVLLLLVLVGSNFSRYFVIAGFEMNRQYIADNLCENKKKPVLNCKGKCYLTKKLQQADEDNKKQNENSRQKVNEIVFLQPFTLIISAPAFHIAYLTHFSLQSSGYSTQHIDGIFRPPRVI